MNFVISSNIEFLQVKFVYEIFKKLRPGIPLKCMHGRMKHEVQQAIVADFNETTSVLFSTDITARGLDIQNVDWVVQVCCYFKHYNFLLLSIKSMAKASWFTLQFSCILNFSCGNLFITFAG